VRKQETGEKMMCREVASGTVHDNVYFTTETGKESMNMASNGK
jgi:hypothetical protein